VTGEPSERAGEWERDERAVALVYGSILTGAAVVAASKIATGPGHEMAYTAATMVVIWLAHSYAAFVGLGGRFEGGRLGRRLLHAMRDELPVLAAVVPALIAMAIAWLLGADVSGIGYAGVAVAILAMCGTAAGAARQAGAGPGGAAAGAAGALVLGAVLITMKIALK
jgi:hypothetical protein